MIIDGKKIAEEILQTLAAQRQALKPVIKLGVLMGEGDAAAHSFVRIKERAAERLKVVVVREMLGEKSTTQEALRALKRLSATDGVIVQLPLPASIDTDAVLAEISPAGDVDGIGTKASPLVHPPVVEAISEIFVRQGVAARGKRAVVVGQGRLVGAPAALWLRSLGAHVSVITNTRGSLEELYDADIVISGAGVPGLIGPQMLKYGVVLIDAGTSEASGRLSGDADPACAATASVFTPVPGGLGPIAVAMIFKNLFTLVRGANL